MPFAETPLMNDHPISRCVEAARSAGYAWAGGEIGKYLKPVLAANASDPEAVVRGWTYWLQRAVTDHNESVQWMTPAAFARRSGFWIQMAKPVGVR